MKKKLLSIFAMVAFIAVGLAGPAVADDTGTVTATVTAKIISITLDESLVEYFVVDLSSVDNVPSPSSFKATNNGSVNEDFAIKGADTADWALGAAGADTYRHRASSDGFSTEQDLTTSFATFTGPTSPAAFETVSLKLDAPTSSSTAAEQSAVVTVLATES